MPDDLEDTPSQGLPDEPGAAPRPNCPVVGIGASAGGIDALRRLFPEVDPASGLAFIIVLHLAPNRQSLLAEVIGRSTTLPVAQIENQTLVEPGHVYVIPPNSGLMIEEGRLLLTPLALSRRHPNVIDEFLTSLAGDQVENAAALSRQLCEARIESQVWPCVMPLQPLCATLQ